LGVPVHITIVTIAGGVNKKMQDDKNKDRPCPVNIGTCANAKIKGDRKMEKGSLSNLIVEAESIRNYLL
jgi:hypothetical protein